MGLSVDRDGKPKGTISPPVYPWGTVLMVRPGRGSVKNNGNPKYFLNVVVVVFLFIFVEGFLVV